MTNSFDEKATFILIILLFNATIAGVYLIWSFIKKDFKKGGMMTIFMLLAPVVGPFYLAASTLLYKIYFKKRKAILNIEELSFRKDKIELMVRDDIESALNKVPIEEALLVSGVHSTRRLLLNVLKEDTTRYVTSINKATYNEDSEVSHYAAAAITDIMNKFKQKEKVLRMNYEEDEENDVAGEMYWVHMSEFLKTNVLPRVEQERYLDLLELLTIQLEETNEAVVTSEMYYFLTNMNIALDRIEYGKLWVDKALKNKPEDLMSYKAGLEFYYESRQFEEYKKLLEKLMNSSIRLDHETLELVRFYQQ